MMAYTKDNLQRLFQSKFNLSKWQTMMTEFFRADKVRIQPETLDEDAEERKGYFLGSTTTKDGYKMGFFYYDMKDGSVLRRKVGLRNLIRPYLGYGFDVALAVFDDGINWRLSLICDLNGDAEATNAKRFTYVFGDEKAYYKTPVSRFFDLQKRADEYLEIKNAFSVEALSDVFFDEYRKQYAEFVKFLTGKVYVKKGNKWVEQKVGEPDAQFFTSFGEDEKKVRDYIKKMMGRIVFLYFLQSKGWLGGNLHYMHDLFYGADDAVKENFLDKVLEPMFFGLLNTKPEDRSTAPLVNGVGVKYIPHAEAIPYLNGGLFQQEQIDEVDSRFPAEMFKSLFDFFDSYNFTIDENDPNDAEVGVDPEMLGKIFENLLEDNKDKGAFYTPKEIVRYMCQESLIAYLQTDIEDEETKKGIANFVKNNDVEKLGGASSNLAMSIDQKLKDVKICDPAIGSGAFPMGLLRELYSCRKAIEEWDDDNAADIKRHIIQNNIYGVDVEKGAVDIARLRFWLALIIDEKEPMPLPNLDFKIMQGNSLLESFMGVDLNMTSKKVKTGKDTKKTRGVLSFGFEETDVQKTIQDLVKSYFSITDHTLRAQRRKEIDKYVKDYIKICAEGNKEVQDAVDELEIPNDQFFLWHTYFNDVFEKGGFDIVIGNPPYFLYQAEHADEIPLMRKNKDLQIAFGGKLNAYKLFLAKAINSIVREGGYVSFIFQNSFLADKQAFTLRKSVLENTQIKILDSFPERDSKKKRVFVSVKMSVCILLLQKTKPVDSFIVNFWDDKYKSSGLTTKFFLQDIVGLDPESYTIPRIDVRNIPLAIKVKSIYPILNLHCFEGELNMTVHKKYFREDVRLPMVLKGASVQRYYWTTHMSQGQVEYLNFSEYEKAFPNSEKIHHHQHERIAMQGMTGANDKVRIVACIIPKNIYLANSCNYLLPLVNFDVKAELALLNSKLMNWYFKCFSTNSNVNGYEIDGLPFLKLEKVQQDKLASLVNDLMNDNINKDTSALENQIDFLIYHLYGLTYDEVLIVDPETPISREEYEAYNIEQ